MPDDTESRRRAEEIFQAAADLAPSERAAFVDRACRGNTALQREVLDLLAFLDGNGARSDFLEEPAYQPQQTEVEGIAPSAPAASGDKASGDDRSAPKQLGEFRITGEIGRGGMGVVYEAEQISLGRKVAVKILPRSFVDNHEARQRFLTEARAAGQLRHRNLVPVFAVGEQDGIHYYAMEFIKGRSLDDILTEVRGDESLSSADTNRTLHKSVVDKVGTMRLRTTPPLTPRSLSIKDTHEPYFQWVCRIFAEIADGLDFAHQNGVIHRDVKPRNVVLNEEGVPMLLDFGVARMETGEKLTMTGEFLGTPAYTSREQLLGDSARVGPHSDVYSLGVTLYEFVTLRLPYEGDSPSEIIHQVLSNDPIPPRKANPRLPKDLETILQTALEPDISRRYHSARDMAADLRHFLNFEPIRAQRASLGLRVRKLMRRNPVAFAGVMVALVAILALGIIAIRARILTSLQVSAGIELAEDHAASGDFAEATAAIDRVLGIEPENDRALYLRAGYQRSFEQAEAARIEDANQLQIDTQVRQAESVLAAAREKQSESERLLSVEDGTSYLATIHEGEAAKARGDVRYKLNLAGNQLVQALTLPTSTAYRRDEIRARAAKVFFDLFLEATAADETTVASAAGEQARTFNAGNDPEIDRVVLGNGILSVTCSVPGASLHLFQWITAPEGTPYEFRLIPAPVDPYGEAPVLGLGSDRQSDVDDLPLGPLGIATGGEILAALDEPDQAPPELAGDERILATSTLPAAPFEHPIRMGSYLLLAQAEGYADFRLPFLIERNEDLELAVRMIPLDRIPEGFVYVPGGRSILYGGERTNFTLPQTREQVDGFIMSAREVTQGQYAEFLNSVRESDPGLEQDLYPGASLKGDYWHVKNMSWPIEAPAPANPLGGVSIANAIVYCKWLSQQTGFTYRLPYENEWERAARGADGRIYPWGNLFLPEFCLNADTFESDRVVPAGQALGDVSPFGIHDMAGSVSELCDNPAAEEPYFARGGSYLQNSFTCTTTVRLYRKVEHTHLGVGFRVVREVTEVDFGDQ